MIDSFKNIERLRYRLSNDMKELVEKNFSKSENAKNQLSNTIFATMFSAFITEVVFGNEIDFFKIFKEKEYFVLWMFLLQLLFFIVFYIVSYFLYDFSYKKIVSFYKERKVNVLKDGTKKMIDVQKDFDNIACDSILLAREYVEILQSLEKESLEDKNLRFFYVYEIMHYLDTACDKTVELVENKSKCIRTISEATGVDIFRVMNIKDIMIEINDFLMNILDQICIDNVNEKEIRHQSDQICKKIDYIRDNLLKVSCETENQ